MVCLLEERVCNLVLLWCITVIAHHCKLVKLQSSISEYKPSDLWSYDDIEVARPENQSNTQLVKNHQDDSHYRRSDDRPPLTIYDDHQSPPSLRNRDHFGSRTNIELPIAAKSNDGEISISKKITFNGNNSRANNHPLWFNTLEKSAMSLPASISFNLKNLYNERKSESTKRPHENPGLIFASKTAHMNTSGSNRNKVKYQQPNYEPEYDEPALPPSLPNLEIIPFVASDALDKPKEPVADRKEGIEYVEDETTPMDAAAMIKKFSPPVLTEGGFIPRDPTLDELYYEAKFNRTYLTSTPAPVPHIIVTEINSEYRVSQSPPKIPEIIVEPTHHQQHSTPSTTTTTQRSTVTTVTAPTTTATFTTTTIPVSTTTTTTEPTPTPSPTTSIVYLLTTKAANYSKLASLLKQNFTSNSITTTTTTTTENSSIEESEEGDEGDSEDEDEETIPLSESEPLQKIPTTNNTKEEPAEPEDNYLLSNILTMIFDDYPAPTKEKTSLAPPATKKSTAIMRSTTTTIIPSSTRSIPPFKHVYIPSTTTTSTTTTTTATTSTESTSTIKSIDKMGFTSTKFSNNKTATMNETQQNQIKYVSLPQTFTYNQPVPKSTPKPVIKERPPFHNEIYHSMKSDSVISGLLKLSGCNIFGKMYKTGEQIDELTEPCSKCMCSEAGVHCIQTKC